MVWHPAAWILTVYRLLLAAWILGICVEGGDVNSAEPTDRRWRAPGFPSIASPRPAEPLIVASIAGSYRLSWKPYAQEPGQHNPCGVGHVHAQQDNRVGVDDECRFPIQVTVERTSRTTVYADGDVQRHTMLVVTSSANGRTVVSRNSFNVFIDADSPTMMIDRLYGHLARDGREHAIRLLDTYRDAEALDVHAVDARWTLNEDSDASADNGKGG
jgi:hypothetical protein